MREDALEDCCLLVVYESGKHTQLQSLLLRLQIGTLFVEQSRQCVLVLVVLIGWAAISLHVAVVVLIATPRAVSELMDLVCLP